MIELPFLNGGFKSDMKIALDVDGTLAETHTPWIERYNKMKGTNFKVSDIRDWHYLTIGSNLEEMLPLYVPVWSEDFKKIKLLADVKLIIDVAKVCNLDIVTSRNTDQNGRDTVAPFMQWLELNGISGVNVVINPPEISKATLNYSLYIDDSNSLASDVQKYPEKSLLLIDRSWNKSVEPTKINQIEKNVKRVKDVNAALMLILRDSKATKIVTMT